MGEVFFKTSSDQVFSIFKNEKEIGMEGGRERDRREKRREKREKREKRREKRGERRKEKIRQEKKKKKHFHLIREKDLFNRLKGHLGLRVLSHPLASVTMISKAPPGP